MKHVLLIREPAAQLMLRFSSNRAERIASALVARSRRQTSLACVGLSASARLYESLRLLRSRRCSSASSCAIRRRWPSRSSRWRRASCERSADVSAMKAAASSGPPSSPGSSVCERRFARPDARFGRLLILAKKLHPNRVLIKYSSSQECNYRTYFIIFQLVMCSSRAPPQHLSI